MITVINIELNLKMFEEDQYYDNNPLQQINYQASKNHNKKNSQKLHSFLEQIDQQHDSEDEGIQDYKMGGYHPVHIGQVLINRYVVIQKLGWGHFSTVWLCKDFKYNTYVAVKIQKSEPHYMDAAFDQVQILQKVQQLSNSKEWRGSKNQSHVIGLLNAFVHKSYLGNHFCMVFQILRCNLLELIKRYNYQGVPLNICQEISKQVLKGLDFLHRVCGVIHTDLKPENVMLCLSDQQLKQIVQTGQLSNNELFAQRTKMIQKMMGLNTLTENSKKNPKIQDICDKLKDNKLNKNQKKTLKKKLKKQLQKEKENESQMGVNYANQDDQNEVKSIEDLFDMKKGKISFNRGEKLKFPFKIKIADLGNACFKHHHFSTEIQTRQYRSPEVILGQSYNETADIWSFGCMMYQMLTGDLLFQPRNSQQWSKNDDHLAQIQQLIGAFHPHFIARSPKRRKYFDKEGKLKRVPSLTHYPLQTVLQLKNQLSSEQAKALAQFLTSTLIAEPQLRISAQKALKNTWLNRSIPQIYKMQQSQYKFLRAKFNENEQLFQKSATPLYDTEADRSEQQRFKADIEQQIEQEGRMCDIRLIDRSFTDVGYIGYSIGISLQELDTQGNWQFLQ